MQGHTKHYFKNKLIVTQYNLLTAKSTVTNYITYLDFISPLVGSQHQVDSIHVDLSTAFDIVSQLILLHDFFSGMDF